MSKPLFSICIPNFNYSQYIGETIDSVLNQTCSDFEIVIQDNASTDDSWQVIQSYVAKDARIRAYRNSYNVGFAPNLQKVTSNAIGKYFILLSSDDLMRSDALEKYQQIIINNGTGELVLGSNVSRIDSAGARTGRIAMTFPCWKLAKDKILTDIDTQDVKKIGGATLLKSFVSPKDGYKSLGNFCATCFSRSLWEKVEGYDTTSLFSPDTNFLVKVLALNPDYFWVSDCLFSYRVHDQNNYGVQRKSYNLKNVIDKYVRTINLSGEQLNLLGVSAREAQKGFLNNSIYDKAMGAFIRGKWIKGMQLCSFGMATFPKTAFVLPKMYASLALGTIGFPFVLFCGLVFRSTKALKTDSKPSPHRTTIRTLN